MTEADRWDVFTFCIAHGFTPNEARIVVALSEPNGKTLDELEDLIYQEEWVGMKNARISLRVQLATIRMKAGHGVTLIGKDEERADALGRIKVWRRHYAVIDWNSAMPSFWDWLPDSVGARRHQKVA